MLRKALLIDSSFADGDVVERCLRSGSFAVVFARDGGAARERAAAEDFDLVILAENLPDEPALALCSWLRSGKRTERAPILFLATARSTAGLVGAFAAGADDYLAKPIVPEELLARALAKCLRAESRRPAHDLMWKGELRFSIGTQRVVRTDENAETDLCLTPNEFRILYLLATHEGETLSRDQILRAVWGENLHVIERTVDKHVCLLRRKLGEASRHLRSIAGAGYSFRVEPDGESTRFSSKPDATA